MLRSAHRPVERRRCSPRALRALALLALGGLAGAGPIAAPIGAQVENAAEAPADVVQVDIEGPLSAGHMALLQRAIRRARSDGAVLLLRVDTPGGEVTRMRQIAAALDEAAADGTEIASWVDDEALSAGVWITLAGRPVLMSEGSTIGAAQVVQLGPGGFEPAPEKIQSAYRAWVRAWAERHGRSPALAEAMVDERIVVRRVRDEEGVVRLMSGREWDDLVRQGREPELVSTISRDGEMLTLTAGEAVALGFADGIASSADEVLGKLGRPGARLVRLEVSRSEEWLGKLHAMRLVLLFAGLLLGYLELKAPGFGLPGILSLACFVALFAGQYLVGLADAPHIALAGAGIALVAVELFLVPGTIWFGLAGAGCLVAALVATQVGPGISLGDAWDRELLLDAAFDLALTMTLALLGAWALSRFLPHTPILGRLVLAGPDPRDGAGGVEATGGSIVRGGGLDRPRDGAPAGGGDASRARPGALGTAQSALRPVGKVRLDGDPVGATHEAQAPGQLLEIGARVRVVAVRAGRLEVEPVPDANAQRERNAGRGGEA